MNTNNKGPHRFRKTYLIVIVAFVFLISGIAMLGWHIAQTDMAAARQNNTDAVITSDDRALQFVLDHRDELFSGLPVSYFGINNRKLANTASGDPLIAGYIEDDCIGDTIRLARKLIPDATNVVGIYDDTSSGHGAMESFLSETPITMITIPTSLPDLSQMQPASLSSAVLREGSKAGTRVAFTQILAGMQS